MTMILKWTHRAMVMTSLLAAVYVCFRVAQMMPPQKMDRLPPLKRSMTSDSALQTHQEASRSPTVHVYEQPEDFPQYFRPKLFKVTPLDFSFLIDSSEACDEDEPPPFLVVLVVSMADHVKARDVIRNTWGRVARGMPWPGEKLPGSVKLLFLFGDTGQRRQTQQLEQEAKLHHDVILASFRESFFNLTYKVLMGFKWVKTFCSAAKYVAKVDDDAFLNLPLVAERLLNSSWNTRICGAEFFNEPRFTEGKYAVSPTAYPMNHYPPHVKGNAYFMSTGIAQQLLTVAEYMPYVNMEDVSITGILARTIGAEIQSFPREEYSPGKPPHDPCSFATKTVIAAKAVSARLADWYWQKIENPHLCFLRERRFPYYTWQRQLVLRGL